MGDEVEAEHFVLSERSSWQPMPLPLPPTQSSSLGDKQAMSSVESQGKTVADTGQAAEAGIAGSVGTRGSCTKEKLSGEGRVTAKVNVSAMPCWGGCRGRKGWRAQGPGGRQLCWGSSAGGWDPKCLGMSLKMTSLWKKNPESSPASISKEATSEALGAREEENQVGI